MKETHDTKQVSHPIKKMAFDFISRSFHWLKMKDDIQAYVKSCLVCQNDKIEWKNGACLLHPLSIPEIPWQCLSMDFIVGFPKVQGYQSVLVVVGRFSKYAVFILAPHECFVEEAARLFFSKVVKHFGIPEDVVSDKDS